MAEQLPRGSNRPWRPNEYHIEPMESMTFPGSDYATIATMDRDEADQLARAHCLSRPWTRHATLRWMDETGDYHKLWYARDIQTEGRPVVITVDC